MLRFGIDLGGTKIEGAVLDATGRVLFRERMPTEADLGYAHIIERTGQMYDRMAQFAVSTGDARHSLGVGTPGSIAPATGRLRNSNTVHLNGQPVVETLERRFGRRFAIQNDANCFALAEALHGAGRGHRMVFGVIIGTGCGGGLVIDGRLHIGRQGIGGEWGHTSIDPNGVACFCGQRGCVETFISGSGLERQYQALTGASLTATDLVAKWRAGDHACSAIMSAFFSHFGRALANLVNILDPDVVVIGGGLSNISEIYAIGVARCRAMVFTDEASTPIIQHELGDSAGVIGAALLGV